MCYMIAQLMVRLACYLTGDAFELSPVGAEATHRSVLEVEPSATKVSPIAQIQEHFPHQKFYSPRISLEQAQYCLCFPQIHWLFSA